MKPKRWYPELLALIAAGFVTRFWDIFHPNAVVFDEVYFKAFAAHYQDGHYYFDIHPPLGKLLLAGWAWVMHIPASAMLNGTAVGLRLLPALAGALLVPLMWGTLRRLGASRPFAFLGALAVLLDNAILVESRFILMDSMLVLFGLSAIYFYLVARDNHTRWHWFWFTLAAIGAGASVSIKWTGLNAIAIVALVWLWDQRGRAATWTKRLTELAILILVPAIIYLSTFWVHFHLLPRSGDGDAFMSTQFQATLQDSSLYDPHIHLSFWDKFTQLNAEMYRANQTLTATHPYGSHWYTWPLEQRPIYYWEGDVQSNGRQGNIYLLGNPLVWWGIWIALFLGLSYLWVSGRKLRPATVSALALAGAAYFINLLPFTGVARVMFLYHYFFSWFFSLIFVIMLWNDLARDKNNRALVSRRDQLVFGGVIALIVLGFIYFSPLTYGLPLSPQGLMQHMWLHSWR
jgi:dolichyl-phosphate-mannose-protein mannosyltransferase